MESKEGGEVESSDSSNISAETTPVTVVRRQKSLTPKSKGNYHHDIFFPHAFIMGREFGGFCPIIT